MVPMSRRSLLKAGIIAGSVVAADVLTPRAAAASSINYYPSHEAQNVVALRQALDAANGGTSGGDPVTVAVPPGTYVLYSTLIVGSNTVLDASAATFYCATGFKTSTQHSTMLLNYVANSSVGGYQAEGNIVVKGGHWDPTWLSVQALEANADATPIFNCNGLTFEHAQDITVDSVTVNNIGGWHAIELNAVKNGIVTNCMLQGWIPDNSVGLWHGEAIQLDLPNGTTTWGGASDNTPCQHITITDNTCDVSNTRQGFGKLVGSHTAATGFVHSDVTIAHNTINNTIWSGIGTQDTKLLTIQYNTFNNCYGGINVKVDDNPVDTVTITDNLINRTYGSAANQPSGVNAVTQNTISITSNSSQPITNVIVENNTVPSDATFSYGATVQAATGHTLQH